MRLTLPVVGEDALMAADLSQQQGSALRRCLQPACFVLLVAVPLLQAFRGLDLSDMGFLLTNQRLIFSHPESVTYWFHLWLTNIIGGLVDLLFGGFGVLPHKIAAVFIFWGTAAGIFLLYRRSLRKELVLPAVTLSMAFAIADKIYIVHYNNLSALLYVLGAAMLSEGLARRRVWLFALSGFVLGLNLFVRLPNAVGLGLVFVPCLLDLVGRDPARKSGIGIKAIAFFFIGAAVAAAAALWAMALLGHLKHYVSALRDLTDTSTKDAGGYSFRRLVKIALGDPFLAMLYGVPLAAGLAGWSAVSSLLKKRWLRVAAGLVLAGIAYGFIVQPALRAGGTRLVHRAVAGLCYWATILMLFDRRAAKELGLAAVLAACLALALNVGSDTGIGVSSYVFPAMFPALLAAAESCSPQPRGFLKASGYRPFLALPLVIMAFFLGVSVYEIKNRVYRDVAEMRRTVHYPQLRGIFTGNARAEILEASLPVISSYVPPGGLLFAHDSVALLHFAAKTRPYLGNPWPALYDSRYLDTLLKREESRAPLPVVVLAKNSARSGSWPVNQDPPVNPEPVWAFLERNRYRLAWENSAFKLYVGGSGADIRMHPGL